MTDKESQAWKLTAFCIACLAVIALGVSLVDIYQAKVFSPPKKPVAEVAPTEAPAQLMTVTAYCPCGICCGRWADGITASGIKAVGKIVAAPSTIPFGTVVEIPGYGVATVQDRGGAITGNKLDVLFPTHQAALEFGVQDLKVRIVE